MPTVAKKVVKKPVTKKVTKPVAKKPIAKKPEPVTTKDDLDDEVETSKPETSKKVVKEKSSKISDLKKEKTREIKEEIERSKAQGHNGGPKFGGVSGEQLRNIITRVEKLEEDKRVISEDIKEVFSEAKANGFDPKIIRKILGLRKMDAAEREELETLIDLYKHALGMIPSDDIDDSDDNEDEDENL